MNTSEGKVCGFKTCSAHVWTGEGWHEASGRIANGEKRRVVPDFWSGLECSVSEYHESAL